MKKVSFAKAVRMMNEAEKQIQKLESIRRASKSVTDSKIEELSKRIQKEGIQ